MRRSEKSMRKMIKNVNAISFEIGPRQGIIIKGGFLVEGELRVRNNAYGSRFMDGREYFIPNTDRKRWYEDEDSIGCFIGSCLIAGDIDYFTQYVQLGLDSENAIRNFEIVATGECHSESRGICACSAAEDLLSVVFSEIEDGLWKDALIVSIGRDLLHQCPSSYHAQEILLQDGETIYGDVYPERMMFEQLQKIPEHLHSRILNYDLRRALHTSGHDFQKGFMTMYFLEQYSELMKLVDEGHKQYTFPFLDYIDKSHVNNRKMLKIMKEGKVID